MIKSKSKIKPFSQEELIRKLREKDLCCFYIDKIKARQLSDRGIRVYRESISSDKASYFKATGRPVYRLDDEYIIFFVWFPIDMLEKRE